MSNFLSKKGFIKKKIYHPIALIAAAILFFLIANAYQYQKRLVAIYKTQRSALILDRERKEIEIKVNKRGNYAQFIDTVPETFADLLLKKEDRFFYYHIGINPASIAREIWRLATLQKLSGSSTLTQQLVKTLLANETKRTLKNKIKEAVYAVSLELFTSKKEILRMYVNTAYFGNSQEGVEQASLYYFGVQSSSLNNLQSLQLLSALNNPSLAYPGTAQNLKRVRFLENIFHIPFEKRALLATSTGIQASLSVFELNQLKICDASCQVTIDKDLSETLRDILARNLESPSFLGVKNGAIVVIKLPENELLAIIGSPHPTINANGWQINMAVKPRPIGSTIKPFIYLNAFTKGARPYTVVEDKEYKYTIGTGFAFYPKNYDGKYRGRVTLHQALSNSLNVPSVKVLEYVGVKDFSHFLQNDLSFVPLQPLENYGLGITLGGLEMDLLTLAHYFTLFPNEGILKPLKIDVTDFFSSPMDNSPFEEKRLFPLSYIQLINKILSDREVSIDQFGMKSNLNLPASNYALKTGTSRNFHDSWTIGYTPDFLVGVWVGNSDNKPMWQISGQAGAGKIWHEVMEVMLNSPYNKKTPFHFDNIKEFTESGSIEYGLEGDDYQSARAIMQKPSLIGSPHNGDIFLLQKGMRIPLKSTTPLEWFINNSFLGKNSELNWQPQFPGTYQIKARDENRKEETITVTIKKEE